MLLCTLGHDTDNKGSFVRFSVCIKSKILMNQRVDYYNYISVFRTVEIEIYLFLGHDCMYVFYRLTERAYEWICTKFVLQFHWYGNKFSSVRNQFYTQNLHKRLNEIIMWIRRIISFFSVINLKIGNTPLSLSLSLFTLHTFQLATIFIDNKKLNFDICDSFHLNSLEYRWVGVIFFKLYIISFGPIAI